MAKIALYTRNIFETGTVTVTGTPDTGFPESRLYDRNISLFYKDTVSETKDFRVDQGAVDILAVDFLAVHRHNFNGRSIYWQYSSDDFSSDIHTVENWTPPDNAQIIKTISSPVTQRYWRLYIYSLTNPKCGEIFMSYGREFEAMINPVPDLKRVSNVRWNRTVGGLERSTKMGDVRRQRSYSLFLDSTDLTAFRAAMDELDEYSLPFWIKDHDGNYFLCRITEDTKEDYDHDAGRTRIRLNVIEML